MKDIDYENLEKLIIEQGILACMLYDDNNNSSKSQIKGKCGIIKL